MLTRRVSILLPLMGCLLASCKDSDPPPVVERQPSPNASILPAPLASARDLVTTPAPAKSGRSPQRSTEGDAGRSAADRAAARPKNAAVNESLPRDDLSSKDSVGLSLQARFQWADVPASPKLPELEDDALREARDATTLSMAIDLAYAGRMRLSLRSPAFPFPEETELRARADYFGHALVWPNQKRYRILAPGSVRAAFAERRPDVTPLMRAELSPSGEGERLGLATVRTRLRTNVGTLDLEQAEVTSSEMSGALLCRFLTEFVSAEPSSPVCRKGRVPLWASFRWAGGGSLRFEVSSLQNREDLPLDAIAVPPSEAKFVPGQLPSQPHGVFLTRSTLSSFRARPRLSQRPPDPTAPDEGLSTHNETHTLKYVLVDGVPVAWVRPHHERIIMGLKPGEYSISWRDFLGMHTEPAEVVQLPARVTIGAAEDAGRQPE